MKWVDEIRYEDNLKIYFFSMNTDIINNWKHTLKKIKQETDFSLSSSSLHNAEIMVSNVSKATGIKMLLKEYNLSKENLMAIGDGENDLPMFELAAYSIAMKNADDTIQEKANEVTKYSYQENGLYKCLVEKLKSKLDSPNLIQLMFHNN